MNNRQPAHPRDVLQKAAQGAVAAAMDRLGLTQEALLENLRRVAFGATRTIHASHNGKITDTLEVDDHMARLAATDRALQLRGAYPAKQFELNGAVKVESLHELTVQLQALPIEELTRLVDAEALALPPAESE